MYVNWRDQVTPTCGWTRIGATPYIDVQDYPANYIKSNTPDQWTCDYRFEDTAQTGHPTNVEIQLRSMYDILGNDQFELWVWDGTSWNYICDVTPTTAMQYYTIDVKSVLDTFEKINAAKIKLRYKEV